MNILLMLQNSFVSDNFLNSMVTSHYFFLKM